MGIRYWVGGSGTWDASDRTHWSTVSGGAGGAWVPSTSDTAYLDANSGAGTVTASAINVKNLDCTGYAGTLTLSSSAVVSGNVKFAAGMTLNHGSQLMEVYAASVVALDFAGKTLYRLTINGVDTAKATLTNDLVCVNLLNVSGIGVFDPVSYNVTGGGIWTDTKTLTLGSGTWTVTDYTLGWSAVSVNPLTGSGNIVLSCAGNTTFAGGGLSYNKLTIAGSAAGAKTTFTGNNRFAELASTKTVAHTLEFTGGTTTRVGKWSINGSAGNLVTLAPSATTNYKLIYTGSGQVSGDYLSISRAQATPAYAWYAGTHSTNGGNNAGWIFSDPPPRASLFFGSHF